uniref:EF-hand domain-containing protein n=1 Tax=Arion vulgaris TaxID=1028688 RepID=A0A0B6ZN71_9EUPU
MADMTKLNEELKAKARVIRVQAKNPLELVQAQFLARGASGIKGVQRRFRIMDDDGNRKLNFEEFSKGIHEVGVVLNKEQEIELFRFFDRDGEGTIDFEEFLRTIQPQMNDRRRKLVEAAFVKMDNTGDGTVTVKDIANAYNAKKHPKYNSGEWSDVKVYQEFLKTFEADGHVDGIVTLDEFISYYASISCSIDSDGYFDLMMRNSWGADLLV